jgi:glycerol-3-phosphate acyltransferase PlsY
MQSLLTALPYFLGAYLLGSLSFAVIVSRLMRLPDPREFGSGNPGATNMLRSGKKTAALLTLIGDIAKGSLAVIIAREIGAGFGASVLGAYAAALGVFIGHLYPVFFGFRGGKGVATALGLLFGILPALGTAVLVTWLLVFGLSRISSLAALTAALLAPLYARLLIGDPVLSSTLIAITLLIFWRHRGNVGRLLRGQESRFGKP